MTENVSLERFPKKASFCQHFYNPIVWVLVVSFIFPVHAFFIQNKFIDPIELKLSERILQIENNNELAHRGFLHESDNTRVKLMEHLNWCDTKLSKFIEERPTERVMKLVLEPLRQDIHELKASYAKTDKKIEEYFNEMKYLINENMK